MRVISGLVGFLRLDVKESFLDTFKRTECFALDSSTADVSASLFLVLVGFGSQITAQGILNAVSEVDNPLVAARIDSLIAHLLTDHVKPVAEFVNNSLGMDFVYPRERLFYFKDIVTQSKSAYFYGATIARRLISRDYYKQRDSTICCSHLQSAAILYLLQADVFQENGIDIREWFSALIWNMDAAVADDFGAVVKAYVSAIFSSSTITPIPETLLWKSFSPENVFSITSADSLDVVSVLQHELYADTVQRTPPYKLFAFEPRNFRKGPQSLLGGMFSKLADEAHRLIKHAAIDLPNACASGNVPLSPILSTIEQYLKYPVSVRMETCGAFSGYICRVALQNCTDDEIVASICQAWFSLHELNPHIVSTATANAWRTEAESTKPKLIPQDVWLDPLVLFRSDSRVFESAGLTDILLTVLSEFLVLSRTSMRRIHSLRQRDSYALKLPHVVAIVQLQESSALQMLIELASLSRNDAVRALIFEFIHARFLEQRVVQKLVHFQAYELSAIDDMVKHVPSMHSCSEFIPEMLMQSLPRLQLFSVRLAASITSNYPIVANEGMTKEVILPHIQTTLVQMAGTVAEEQLAISNAMLEAVIRINSVFTLIRQDCIRLVNAVRNAAIEKAQPALQDNQQPQQCDFIQSIAKWVGSCDKVLEIIGDVNPDTGRSQYTQIEDVNADEFVSAVELSAKSRDKNMNISHKPPPSASNTADPGTQQPGMAIPMSPSLVGLPTHPPGQTLSPFSSNLSQPHGGGPTSGNAKRSHNTAMSSSVGFGRGRGAFGNPGSSRGSSSATGPLSNLTEQGNAAASSAQMAVSPGSSSPGASAGFKRRTRSRSRPPRGKEMNGGGKPAAIGLKRAKVPGGDRPQRGKDH
ncbi:Integrator complex subunit 2 [Coemansia sp. RSA 2399]|nr:Integrator complex subunit 2 [Coemansia sp. RSA 2399]